MDCSDPSHQAAGFTTKSAPMAALSAAQANTSAHSMSQVSGSDVKVKRRDGSVNLIRLLLMFFVKVTRKVDPGGPCDAVSPW